MASVCSPSGLTNFQREKTCFNRAALVRLANAWNASRGEEAPITGIGRKNVAELWRDVNKRMAAKCGEDITREGCWVDALLGSQVAGSTSDTVSDPAVGSVKPRKPRGWYKQPFTWLTNLDIEAVMRQYEANADFKYAFLGVFPIDFADKDAFGRCLVDEICAIRIAPYIKRGVRYLGLITNLDRHDQSGSHWTSLFVCMDPTAACYGAYYYDSVGRPTPNEVTKFIESLRAQLREIYPDSDGSFKTEWNRNQHQFANTECGIFSMIYQIRWLKLLQTAASKKQGKAVIFQDIVNIKITDKDVHKLRDVLYRPEPPARI